jgi:ech hydrogenase subunit A
MTTGVHKPNVNLASLLIVIPPLLGLGLLFVRFEGLRRWIVGIATALLALGSIALTAGWAPVGLIIPFFGGHAASVAMLCLEVSMGSYIVWVGIRRRRPLIVILLLAQLLPMVGWELYHSGELHAECNLVVDRLSAIMALINGIVGGAICLYALAYMREFHRTHHPECPDRRPFFFCLLFVFLGAMFGVVFANNLLWLYFFWEVTTLCSFLLIGYRQNEESIENALRALLYNLIGGLAFAAAIIWFFRGSASIELSVLIKSIPAVALAPAALLSFAGITKAAQFPFSRWLLGAMVAPTPVSALLHSSSMVKAGVYLVIRLAPILQGNRIGIVVALVGAVSFATASFAAVCTSDAKKVLAYSTVANLGLIVLCGGIGTHEAVWAGVLLIIFHAVAKCLLFLCVGVIEHKLHSRDIERMSGLILSMPRVSIMLQIGIAGMFLAPFGMLIGKWAVLKAVVDTYPAIMLFIVFGSAPTLFFWMKWMGKLLEVTKPIVNVEKGIGPGEWSALYLLTGITALTCILFPWISTYMVEPYVIGVYGQSGRLAHGNLVIMTIMFAMVALFPLSFFNYGRRVKVLDPYLGGMNASGGNRFAAAAGDVQEVRMANYYLTRTFNEPRVFRIGVAAGLALSCVLFAFVLLS